MDIVIQHYSLFCMDYTEKSYNTSHINHVLRKGIVMVMGIVSHQCNVYCNPVHSGTLKLNGTVPEVQLSVIVFSLRALECVKQNVGDICSL